MRTAVYTRISKDTDQQGKGVERQLAACAELADQLGWEVVERYDDNDISAYSGRRRPGFERMLDDMAAGHFAALIVWHTDRLYRSMKDLERLIDVADQRRVQLKTVEGGDLDLGTSAGRMLGRILGATARQESEHHAERRTAANLQRAAAGQWCNTGNRPFGYTKSGEPLEPEASMLRQAAADILAGHSLHSIAATWNAAGHTTTKGAKWSNLHVRRVLTNPRIAALRVHQGTVIGAGNWKPILDADTFRGLSAYLQDPSRKNAVAFERRYLLSGIAICGICGQKMYATHPHGRDRAMVYACRPTAHVARVGAPLDQLIESVALKVLSGSDIHRRLGTTDVLDVSSLHTDRAALQARLDELAAMFAAGHIDASQLRRGTTDLRTQLTDINKTLADLARTSPASKLLAEGGELNTRWAALSVDLRGKIVDELMTVRVMPAPRGSRFSPEFVEVKPR
jgi:site-specific DNA recombinase